MALRTFICLEIPKTERDRLRALQDELRRFGARVSWPAAGNIHLTLVFLGDVDETRVDAIAEALERAARRAEPFSLLIDGAGGFPTVHRPRVIWAGIGGELDALGVLHAEVTAELALLGVPRDEKAFRPHLTLGRVKDDRDPALRRAVETLRDRPLVGEPFPVREVVLMKSDLGSGGSTYTPLSRATLGAPTRA